MTLANKKLLRYLAIKNIQQITSNHHTLNKQHKEQMHTAKQIQQKLTQHKATITEADKGKTLVII
jgi:hypothetical protein